MHRNRLFKKTAFLLAAALLAGLFLAPALPAEAAEAQPSVFQVRELEALVQELRDTHHLTQGELCVGYYYPPTGESWYYQGDLWLYAASLYKLPLMMVYENRVYTGALSPDALIEGYSLAEVEEPILTYSNNEYASILLEALGLTASLRLFAQYSDVEEADIPLSYYTSMFFSARFITGITRTLYERDEEFPHVTALLKQAQPNDYFRLLLGDTYEIAQKYGNYDNYMHTTGIIYTPHPFVLTVMTQDLTDPEGVIGHAAKIFAEYTLLLDTRLEAARAAEAPAPENAAEEAAETPAPTHASAAESVRPGGNGGWRRLLPLFVPFLPIAALLLAAGLHRALAPPGRKRRR